MLVDLLVGSVVFVVVLCLIVVRYFCELLCGVLLLWFVRCFFFC